MVHGARDGLDEKRGAEHIGVVDLARSRIVGKVHRQAPHHRIALAGAHPGHAVDVGQQPVAQMRRIKERVVDLGRERFEDVGLAFDARSVNAIDRVQRAELMPARVEFLVLGIVFAANIIDKEAAGVLSPIGQARHGDVDAAGNLRVQRVPACRGVARPRHGGVALLACPGRTREREDALVAGGALSFISALRGDKSVGIQITREVAHGVAAQALDVGLDFGGNVTGPADLDLGSVHPQRIDAHIEQSLFDVLEVDGAALGTVGVVDAGRLRDPVQRRKAQSLGVEFARQRRIVADGGPDRVHQLDVQLVVQYVGQPHRIWIAFLVPSHAAPCAVGAAPVLPILHDVIERKLRIAEVAHDFDEPVLRLIALLAHEQAVGLAREHGRLPGQLAIAGDDAVHIVRSHEIIIHACRRALGPERRTLGRVLVDRLRVNVPENAVAARRDQHRHHRADIGLHQKNLLAAIVHVGVIVLTQTVERLVRRERETLLHLVGGLAGDRDLLQLRRLLRALARNLRAIGLHKRQCACLLVDDNSQFSRSDDQLPRLLVNAKRNRFRMNNDCKTGLYRVDRSQRGVDAHDAGAVEEHVLYGLPHAYLNPVL